MGYFTLLYCSSLLAVFRVSCYNIDTDQPLVYAGPAHSYFGYSVALLNNSRGSWVLAGAPKSDSQHLKGIKAPGALFKCALHQGDRACQEVLLDDSENGWELIGKVRAKSRKDNQWLGASMDIKPSFGSKITVCAPHWSDAKFIGYHYLVNGMCFEIGADFNRRSLRKVYPLVVKGKQVHQNGNFVYGSGMAGFAAHYAQDGSLLLGAPGVNDWKGGLARYEQKKKAIAGKFSEQDGYAGYSLSSGRLYGDNMVYYVTGAPRASGTGLVYILNKNMQITSKVSGKQIGENFGCAVEVVDVNGDGLDDLIIGAPLYSYSRDEGRAYIFINKDLGIFHLSKTILEGTNAVGGHFGAAISSLRDVDIDGFPDIVIGAPFEEEGVGCIYIYNGYSGGLRSDFSQRITGKELGSELLAFGAAFSRVHDIDGNTYGDFAVGAFLSDKAVVLRGKPVINVEVQIKFSVKTIDLKERGCKVEREMLTCFTVTVCFQFDRSSSVDDIDIRYTLTADTMEKRVAGPSRISLQVKRLRDSVTARANLTKDRYSCQQHRAIAFETQDIITPVKFGVSFEMVPINTTTKSSVQLQPVLNKYKSKKASKQILYVKDCGTDNICMSDLQLETQLNLPNQRDYLISGEDSYISHQITVTNLGERAYLTNVVISYPASLQYVRVNTIRGARGAVCTPSLVANDTLVAGEGQRAENRTLVVCDIGNPVTGMVLFVVKMFVDSRHPEPDPLQIRTVVRTASRQQNDSLSDSAVIDYLLIRLKAGLIVTGISSPEQRHLLRTDLKSSENKITEQLVRHVYEVGNLGPSTLPFGTMYLTVVLDDRLKGLVRVDRLEVIDPARDLVKDNLCALNQPADDVTVSVAPESVAPVPADPISKQPHITYSPYPSDNGVPLLVPKCEGGVCIRGHCAIRNLEAQASVHVQISMYVQSNVFVEIQESDLIHLNSSAKFVEDLDPMYIAAPSSDRYNKTVVTVLYTEISQGGVSLWALIASLSSGFLVVMVIIILLWRGGFFRRKKKEELARLIEEIESERGSRLNTIENDNQGMRLQPIRRRHEVTSSGSGDYEEPILSRNSGVANGHGSRAVET